MKIIPRPSLKVQAVCMRKRLLVHTLDSEAFIQQGCIPLRKEVV
jgi:hypothetical protein